MKNNRFFYLSIILLFFSCNRVSLINEELKLQVDNHMNFHLQTMSENHKTISDSFIAPDELFTLDTCYSSFKLVGAKKINDELYLKGVLKDSEVWLEKLQQLKSPKGHKGMMVLKTCFVNKGKDPIQIKSLVQNKVKLFGDTTLWSFQPSSTEERKDWILPIHKGFKQNNFLGMNSSDYGGGIPMISLWRKDLGLSIGLIEPVLKQISMPISWNVNDSLASMEIKQDFTIPIILNEGDTLKGFDSFILLSHGDFYNPLRQFSTFMQEYQDIHLTKSDSQAYEPVWCAWGYGRTFTIDQIIKTLPKAKELGFTWVDVDDGYQIAEGDWETNKRFPHGDLDMRKLTDAIHHFGMKAKIWWAPLAADSGTYYLTHHPESLLTDQEGKPQKITYWDSFYLSPVNKVTRVYTSELIDRFIRVWNFDGLKLDGQHLNCCSPDYNKNSHLSNPNEAVEQLPSFFRLIYDQTRSLKKNAVIQLCPCGCAFNYFNLPYLNQAVASDPLSSWQIRLKGKAYKAMNPNLAYYADHVELSDHGDDFATQLGIGAVLGSKFTYPLSNIRNAVQKENYLTSSKEVEWKKWIKLYNEYRLSEGEYLNLYDIGWDKPEAHVIQKDGDYFYAFYAAVWKGDSITLRGLNPNKVYKAIEYTNDPITEFEIKGKNPIIRPHFKGAYLLKLSELK